MHEYLLQAHYLNDNTHRQQYILHQSMLQQTAATKLLLSVAAIEAATAMLRMCCCAAMQSITADSSHAVHLSCCDLEEQQLLGDCQLHSPRPAVLFQVPV
jgi:hypothetical protein